MPFFVEPEEALDYIHALVNTNKELLGLGYVGYADETLLPKYPAAVVSFSTPVDRELITTGTFNLNWQVQIIIYHARISASHKTRSREDMLLATAVRDLLHTDKTMGGGVIFGYVRSERPGIIADDKGRANVATVLTWTGDSRAPING